MSTDMNAASNGVQKDASADLFGDDMSVEKATDARGTMRRLVARLMGQKGRLLVILASTLASTLFGIVAPLVLGDAINLIADGAVGTVTTGSWARFDARSLLSVLTALLVTYLLQALFSFIQQNTMASVAQTLTLELREDVATKIGRLPLKYFDTHNRGEIMTRVTNDLERVANTLQESVTELASAAISIVGSIVMMFVISPELTLIALVSIVASAIVAGIVSGYTQEGFAENQSALGALNSSIEESFTGNTIIKAFSLEGRRIEETGRLNDELCKAGGRAMFYNYVITPVVRFLGQFGYVLIAVRGAFAVMDGQISIGDIQAFFQYVNNISEPIADLSYIVNSLQGAVAASERVFELLDEPEEEPDPADPLVIEHPQGHVRFEHVRFGYAPDAILMHDVNFDAPAGSTFAIVGPTGAGKTTLVNLLMRFYELDGGRITIDGEDIARMRRDDLRSLMGMVLQDTWLFDGSIRDNIAYGRADATDEQVRAAATAARADYFIRTMPNGYDTVLDDEVSTISQGQRQLLTIARAILADPQILVLDEATSSVDTRTEAEIQKAMAALMKGRTSFVIAHRLSTIRNADCILVMNHGTIIEHGTHDELMRRHGFYADLYESQFSHDDRAC